MLSSPLALADIDAVNATTARTKEERIVCENAIYMGSNEPEGDSRKTAPLLLCAEHCVS
jgi:hypothetical protein